MKYAGQLPENWELTQCLFGEHLLSAIDEKQKTVALVESEKTAIIASCIMPKYIWLATGGKSQFNHIDIADRLYILDHVSSWKNITPESVEKDWWVTAVLKCMFDLTVAPYMYFKGGTSLSKGWSLIDRFSEDIDIALYRDFFLNELHKSCAACTTNNQIMNLRKVSKDYVRDCRLIPSL